MFVWSTFYEFERVTEHFPERSGIVTGAEVRPGDRVLGLASSGLHSNGYSLARKVIFERLGLKLGDTAPGLGRSVAEELLEPTRIYVKPVLDLLRSVPVLAMAHVTGGGITENLPRVLPEGCQAVIDPPGLSIRTTTAFTAESRAASSIWR